MKRKRQKIDTGIYTVLIPFDQKSGVVKPLNANHRRITISFRVEDENWSGGEG